MDPLARFLHGHRWWVVVGALAFTAFAAWRVPDLIANIRVNRGALQDPENPVRKRFDHVVSQFGTPFLNIVVLEGDDRASLRQTADAVAAALSAPLPAGVAPTGDDPCADPRFVGRSVRDVFHRVDLGQFERKGIYYLSAEELRALGEGLAGADREGGAGLPPLTGLQDALDGIVEGFAKGSAGAGEDAASGRVEDQAREGRTGEGRRRDGRLGPFAGGGDRAALARAVESGADVCIVDTAGRLQTQQNLMQQLTKIHRVLGKLIPDAPHEVLLVLDATTGQNGISQARHFTDAVRCTGIILAKLDGTAKGGVVVAIRQQVGLPVKYVGVGEKMEDLALFNPDEFVDALFVRDEQDDAPARSGT